MEEIRWYKHDVYCEDHLERFIIGRYQNKLLGIKINFKCNGLEAILKSFIIKIDKETDETKSEHFQERYYIGIGETFFKKINDEINSEKFEMEKIVKREDENLILPKINLYLL